MNSCSSRASSPFANVNDEIADLTEEIVLICVPVGTAFEVRIGIDHSHSLEVLTSQKSWRFGCVAYHLSIVEHLNWLADHVLPWWKVGDGWVNGGGIALLEVGQSTASVAVRYGFVDRVCVVGYTVTFGAVVHNITKNSIVSLGVFPDCVFGVVDVRKPIAACCTGAPEACGAGMADTMEAHSTVARTVKARVESILDATAVVALKVGAEGMGMSVACTDWLFFGNERS